MATDIFVPQEFLEHPCSSTEQKFGGPGRIRGRVIGRHPIDISLANSPTDRTEYSHKHPIEHRLCIGRSRRFREIIRG